MALIALARGRAVAAGADVALVAVALRLESACGPFCRASPQGVSGSLVSAHQPRGRRNGGRPLPGPPAREGTPRPRRGR